MNIIQIKESHTRRYLAGIDYLPPGLGRNLDFEERGASSAIFAEFYYLSDSVDAAKEILRSFDVVLEYPLTRALTAHILRTSYWTKESSKLHGELSADLVDNMQNWKVYVPILKMKKIDDKLFQLLYHPRKGLTNPSPIVHTKERTYNSICQVCDHYAEHLANICAYPTGVKTSTSRDTPTICPSEQKFILRKDLV
jgi:hypothetical protein